MKLGRPKKTESRIPLPTITFRVDEETELALRELETEFSAVRGRRSVLLRRLILEAARTKK